VFRKFDIDGTGIISREHLSTLLRDLDPDMPEDSIAQVLETTNPNMHGGIEYTEFCKWLFSEARPRRKWRTMGRSNSLKFIPGNLELSQRSPTEKTFQDEELIAQCLRSNQNMKRFAEFSDAQINLLVGVAWKEIAPKGWILMSEGSLHNSVFYIVASGSFEIVAREPFEVVKHCSNFYLDRPDPPSQPAQVETWQSRPLTVQRVGMRTTVGDSSMIYGTPRWAKVTAMEQSVVWVISQSDFHIVRLQATDAQQIETYPDDKELIAKALQANANLQALTPLDTGHVMQLVPLARRVVVEQGQVFMNEGDLQADAFYIVGEGSFEVSSSEPLTIVAQGGVSYLSQLPQSDQPLDQRSACRLGRGSCFGEVSMLYCAPRSITVEALEGSVLWAIDRSSFQMVQMKAAEDEMKDRVKHLNRLEVLSTFTKEDKEKVAGAMELMRLTQGEVLWRQGDACTILYVLYEGSVSASVDGNLSRVFDADSGSGVVHIFGENALMGTECCLETIQVTTATATVLMLERDNFVKVWDRLVEAAPAPLFQRNFTTATRRVHSSRDELSLENLSEVGLLGCVEFLGSVELCMHKHTKELYALKSLSKGLIVQKGLRTSIMRERMLWMEVISPFIIRLIATFNEPQCLCFLLEAATGGELSSVYGDEALYGSAEHAKYYTAGVVLGLEHLHKRRIVYRNVKPRNVLLSKIGQPKLTDMSLAKLVVGHTFTTCGTPTYMAPEIISGRGHTRAVDWWSLGVLVFELMSGRSPFDAELPMEVYSKAFRGIAKMEFPKACAGSAEDFVRALLQPTAIDRLAMRQGGIGNVMGHAWFAGFDWTSMRDQSLPPPYVPTWMPSPGDKDVKLEFESFASPAHFSTQKEQLPMPVLHCDDFSAWDEGFAT